ncbi:MAG: hypothetical protein BWY59_01273 [Verrucomicrobia bacterium ADurb.Bin345]|nr:MAG: hypothetical protein BWY59_01273 [Verrucomicrobia bacterium ADurb.Bin345]
MRGDEFHHRFRQRGRDAVREPLARAARAQHARAEHAVERRAPAFEIRERQLRLRRRVLEVPRLQNVPLEHGHLAGVDVHRARLEALVACRAMVRNVLQKAQAFEPRRARALRVVEQRLDQRADGEVLVARVIEEILRRVEDAAIRLALSAADALRDLEREFLQRTVLENPRLEFEQVERRREHGVKHVGILQFARIQDPAGIQLPAVVVQLADAFRFEVLELGDPDAVLAADHAAHLHRRPHRVVRFARRPLHHLAVVREHRDVEVHIPVARVHVRREDDTPRADVRVNLVELGLELPVARKQFAEPGLQVLDDAFAAQFLRRRARQLIRGLRAQLARLRDFLREPLGVFRHRAGLDELAELADQALLVEPALRVVPLVHVPRETGKRLERQHDVLVELERVGVRGDRAQFLAVLPEPRGLRLVARREHARVGIRLEQALQLARAVRQLLRRVADEVNEQDRLGRVRARRLVLVADGAHVLVVEMLQRLKHLRTFRLERARDVHDHAAGLVHVVAVELQAERLAARIRLVQDELGRRDNAVGPFLLQAGQAAQRLVRHILPEPGLANLRTLERESLQDAPAFVRHLEFHQILGTDLAARMPQAPDLDVRPVRERHPVAQHVVYRRPPQHGHLAARVLGDVAADRGSPRAGRVGGENLSAMQRVLDRVIGDDARLHAQRVAVDAANAIEFFRVDYHAAFAKRHRAAGQARARAARYGVEAEFADRGEKRRDLFLAFRKNDGGRQAEPPVRGVGRVAHERKRVEQHVFLADDGAKLPAQQRAAGGRVRERSRELAGHLLALIHHSQDLLVVPRAGADGLQLVAHLGEEGGLAARVVEQVLDHERVALEDEEVADDPHEQARRAAGDAPRPEPLEPPPRLVTEQEADDLPVLGRCVVVRYLAHSRYEAEKKSSPQGRNERCCC